MLKVAKIRPAVLLQSERSPTRNPHANPSDPTKQKSNSTRTFRATWTYSRDPQTARHRHRGVMALGTFTPPAHRKSDHANTRESCQALEPRDRYTARSCGCPALVERLSRYRCRVHFPSQGQGPQTSCCQRFAQFDSRGGRGD